MTDFDTKELERVYNHGKEAAFKLALVHMHGLGCSPEFPRNRSCVEPLLREAAAHKVPGARSELGEFLDRNNRRAEAIQVWREAAKDDEVLAQVKLGEKGFDELKRRAEAGDPISQYHVAFEMFSGPRKHRSLDYRIWYERAIAQGHETAKGCYEEAELCRSSEPKRVFAEYYNTTADLV